MKNVLDLLPVVAVLVIVGGIIYSIVRRVKYLPEQPNYAIWVK